MNTIEFESIMVVMLHILGIVGIVLLIVVSIIFTGTYINHKIKLKREVVQFPCPGTKVSFDGLRLHVFSEGDGETTLVFLAGHATSSPMLDFKPLWSLLSDSYRIVVVERAGYGHSDGSTSPRDIETVLEQTRRALELSGHSAPYVLIPHSMSGLEAIRWAQKYPSEVEAIIGLDACVPASIDILPAYKSSQLSLLHVLSASGFIRFLPKSDINRSLPLFTSGVLSEFDRACYVALFYRSAVTADMVREFKALPSNAARVGTSGVPSKTPMVFFLSEEQEKTAPGWIGVATEYLSMVENGSYTVLPAGHYVHHTHSEVIAAEVREYLRNLT